MIENEASTHVNSSNDDKNSKNTILQNELNQNITVIHQDAFCQLIWEPVENDLNTLIMQYQLKFGDIKKDKEYIINGTWRVHAQHNVRDGNEKINEKAIRLAELSLMSYLCNRIPYESKMLSSELYELKNKFSESNYSNTMRHIVVAEMLSNNGFGDYKIVFNYEHVGFAIKYIGNEYGQAKYAYQLYTRNKQKNKETIIEGNDFIPGSYDSKYRKYDVIEYQDILGFLYLLFCKEGVHKNKKFSKRQTDFFTKSVQAKRCFEHIKEKMSMN